MNHDSYDNSYISGILDGVKTIAMVGASANDVRPSFFVMKYLLDKGFRSSRSIPARPAGQILGRMSMRSSPTSRWPSTWSTSSATPAPCRGIVDEVLALDPLPKVIWMQLGVRHDEAAARLEEAGIQVVMNRCPKIEYGRLSGEIGWTGVNSGVLSSKRPVMRQGFQSFGIRQK